MRDQEDNYSKKQKWLVVGWPGVCGVASQVIQRLDQGFGAETIAYSNAEHSFQVDEITIRNGVVFPGQLPKMIFRNAKLGTRHDLLLFQPERQPESGGLDLCRNVLRTAVAQGAKKVVTFAAQASTIDPRETPTVSYCCTDPVFGNEVKSRGVQPIQEGKVKGLNGLMLLAAQEQGLPALCLIGEVPTQGLQMLNPKTTRSLLHAFLNLTGAKLDLSYMDDNIRVYEDYMLELSASSQEISPSREFQISSHSAAEAANLEDLFQEAAIDRNSAMFLKSELDRLGLYLQFEDRFLDLFRDCS
ncbi:MAG: PAC2 family protein [bacterium]